jgi:hypothetical protein
MPEVINLPAIPREETPAPVQATKESLITKAHSTINTEMDHMMKAFAAWTFQLRKANEYGFVGESPLMKIEQLQRK